MREILGDGAPALPPRAARARTRRRHDRPRRGPARRPARRPPARWLAVRRPARARRLAHRVAAGARTSTSWPRRSTATTATSRSRCTGPWTLAAGDRAQPRREGAGRPGRRCATSSGRWPRGCASTSPRCSASSPARRLVLQLDEPSLPAVLAGRLPTASGYGHLRAVDPQTAMNGLRDVLAAAPEGTATVVHCCDPGIPLPLLRATGVGAVALDVTALTPARWESIAATVEDGVAAVCRVPADRRHRHRARRRRPGRAGLARRRHGAASTWATYRHPGLRAGRTHTRGGLARSTCSGRRGRGMVRTSRELTRP